MVNGDGGLAFEYCQAATTTGKGGGLGADRVILAVSTGGRGTQKRERGGQLSRDRGVVLDDYFQAVTMARKEGWLGVCLLYTSDAADE